jgi:hypothetical protein
MDNLRVRKLKVAEAAGLQKDAHMSFFAICLSPRECCTKGKWEVNPVSF